MISFILLAILCTIIFNTNVSNVSDTIIFVLIMISRLVTGLPVNNEVMQQNVERCCNWVDSCVRISVCYSVICLSSFRFWVIAYSFLAFTIMFHVTGTKVCYIELITTVLIQDKFFLQMISTRLWFFKWGSLNRSSFLGYWHVVMKLKHQLARCLRSLLYVYSHWLVLYQDAPTWSRKQRWYVELYLFVFRKSIIFLRWQSYYHCKCSEYNITGYLTCPH